MEGEDKSDNFIAAAETDRTVNLKQRYPDNFNDLETDRFIASPREYSKDNGFGMGSLVLSIINSLIIATLAYVIFFIQKDVNMNKI